MTPVRIKLTRHVATGKVPAKGRIIFRPTWRAVEDDSVVLPTGFTIVLDGTETDGVITPLAPTPGDLSWVWSAQERVQGGQDWTFLVPDTSVEQDYATLEAVDATSSCGNPPPPAPAAWNKALALEIAARIAADEDLQEQIDSGGIDPEELEAMILEVLQENPQLIPVNSVNAMQGDVVLDAADVGAYTTTEVDGKLSAIALTPGPDGDSAYQVAVEQGFVGTEAQWLASLKGVPGEGGDDGDSAYQVAVDNGFLGTESQWLASLNGQPGEDGDDSTVPGPPGPTAVSSDADNAAWLGSDNLIYVAPISASAPQSVLVEIGDEERPTGSDLVIWISPSGVWPANAVNTDVVYLPGNVTPPDTEAPTAPTDLTASNITANGFTVSWEPGSDNAAIDVYLVTLNNGAPGETSGTSRTFTGLDPDTEYTVRIIAYDTSGNASPEASLVVRTLAVVSTLFSDDFNRADGIAGNAWVGGSSGDGSNWLAENATISGNALRGSNYGGYGFVASAAVQKSVSVRATFTDPISAFQGIFLAHNTTANNGIKLFNNGGVWVIGNSATYASDNTSVVGAPAGATTLRLDYNGTVINAWIGGVQVLTDATPASLSLTMVDSGDNLYRVGYCGEGKTPGMDSFEVVAL